MVFSSLLNTITKRSGITYKKSLFAFTSPRVRASHLSRCVDVLFAFFTSSRREGEQASRRQTSRFPSACFRPTQLVCGGSAQIGVPSCGRFRTFPVAPTTLLFCLLRACVSNIFVASSALAARGFNAPVRVSKPPPPKSSSNSKPGCREDTAHAACVLT